MNKDLKNNVEVEQDEYGSAYTDPGDVKDNVFAQAMEQAGIEKIRETMREARAVADISMEEIEAKFAKDSVEREAANAFQEEVLKSISEMRRDMDARMNEIQDQLARITLIQQNQNQLKAQEQEKVNKAPDFKKAFESFKEKVTQARDVTVNKVKDTLSHVREAAEKTLENVRQFRIEKERDVLKAADRGIMKQKEIMLNYNRQMAKMHENVKNKLVEIRKGLDTKAKDFSVAKEAVKNLFRREEKKVDIENMQEQTNLFSKLSSTLAEQIGFEEDAAHGYNEKASDIEKEMSDIKDKWQMIGETLDRQEKDEEIDIEESELDKDDEREVLGAADQMLEASSFDDLLKDANEQAAEINQQTQDNDIDRDINKDYER